MPPARHPSRAVIGGHRGSLRLPDSPKVGIPPRTAKFLPGTADFGEVKQNQTLPKKVKLYNPLHSPITIEYINKSCGCLSATIDKSVIPPRGEAELELAWETRKHEFETKDKTLFFTKGTNSWVRGLLISKSWPTSVPDTLSGQRN